MVQKRSVRIQRKAPRKKKATPFADAGAIAGDRIGRFLGYPMLKGVGKWLGSGIGSILGSGDYQMMGSSPKYNVLVSDVQVPQFSSNRQTNIVCHREYLTDIVGTSGFNLTKYAVNPGLQETFPWLSTLAQNYQEYRIHGIIFEFRSLITDFVTGGAPGVIVMATNYNADAPLYSSKQEMENSEYAVATKPTLNLIHGLECAPNQTVLPEKYVRTGSVPTGQDLRMYDLGNVQVATQGNPAQLLGELWISYCVEFFKPRMPDTVGGDVDSGIIRRTNFNGASPLGLIGIGKSGTLNLTMTPTTLAWIGQPGNKYQIVFTWSGTVAGVWTAPSVSFGTLTQLGIYANGISIFPMPGSGASTTYASVTMAGTCNLTNPGLITVSFGTNGVFPTGTTDVVAIVTLLDSSIAYPEI
jgi:hypothetical protein